jgi:hypothetical protein
MEALSVRVDGCFGLYEGVIVGSNVNSWAWKCYHGHRTRAAALACAEKYKRSAQRTERFNTEAGRVKQAPRPE